MRSRWHLLVLMSWVTWTSAIAQTSAVASPATSNRNQVKLEEKANDDTPSLEMLMYLAEFDAKDLDPVLLQEPVKPNEKSDERITSKTKVAPTKPMQPSPPVSKTNSSTTVTPAQ